jgi:cell division protein FtsL
MERPKQLYTLIASLAAILIGLAAFNGSLIIKADNQLHNYQDRIKGQDNRLDQQLGQIRDLQLRVDRLEDLLAEERLRQLQRQVEARQKQASAKE